MRNEVVEIRVSELVSEIELLQSSASVNAELADLENVIGQEMRSEGGAEGHFGGEAHFLVVIASYELSENLRREENANKTRDSESAINRARESSRERGVDVRWRMKWAETRVGGSDFHLSNIEAGDPTQRSILSIFLRVAC